MPLRVNAQEVIDMNMDRYMWQLVKDILSTSEYNALLSKLKDESYDHKDFDKAIKKLKALGLEIH